MGSSSLAQTVARGSARLLLARLALRAASEVPSVLGTDSGPQRLRVVADPPELLRGVSVTAEGDGRYAVDLCLVAGMVPLHALAEDVRERVRSYAKRERLESELGTINVEFATVMSEEEATAAASATVVEALDALAHGPAAIGAQTIEAQRDVGAEQAAPAERTLGTEQLIVEADQGIEGGPPLHPQEATHPEEWIIEGKLAIKGVPGQSPADPAQHPRPAEEDSAPPFEAGEGRPR